MRPTELYLTITQCHCSCGHSWVHSRPILKCADGSIGGTPNPIEEARLQVTRLINTTHHYHHCFRCVPLGLGIGWTFPEPTKPRGLDLAQLEKGIFND